jgi:hypothetical protein
VHGDMGDAPVFALEDGAAFCVGDGPLSSPRPSSPQRTSMAEPLEKAGLSSPRFAIQAPSMTTSKNILEDLSPRCHDHDPVVPGVVFCTGDGPLTSPRPSSPQRRSMAGPWEKAGLSSPLCATQATSKMTSKNILEGLSPCCHVQEPVDPPPMLVHYRKRLGQRLPDTQLVSAQSAGLAGLSVQEDGTAANESQFLMPQKIREDFFQKVYSASFSPGFGSKLCSSSTNCLCSKKKPSSSRCRGGI